MPVSNSRQEYFPVRGHYFLSCDRDFGLIKIFLEETCMAIHKKSTAN
jgi:hypothetical protein